MPNPLDVRAVQIVASVVRLRSFTLAAEELGIAQASVSQRVRQLEEAIGATLIDRKTKVATPPGRILIEHGDRAAGELAAARGRIDDLLGSRSGTLRLGVIQMVGFLDLPGAIADFCHSYPTIDIALVEDNADEMLEMLLNAELDLVISNVASNDQPPAGLAMMTLGDEGFVLVAEPGRFRDVDARAALHDLQHEPMASFGRRSAIRATADALCAELEIQPSIAFETNRREMMEGLVSRGLAWALVPRSHVGAWTSDVATWEVDAKTRREVGITWSVSRGLLPSAERFRDHLKRAASLI